MIEIVRLLKTGAKPLTLLLRLSLLLLLPLLLLLLLPLQLHYYYDCYYYYYCEAPAQTLGGCGGWGRRDVGERGVLAF